MDLLDREAYFSSCVPAKALNSPLLQCSAVAIAAKQLGRIKAEERTSPEEFLTPAIMQIYGHSNHIDWSYKAATYYDRAISYLQLYLCQALPRYEITSLDGNHPANHTVSDSESTSTRGTRQISIAHEIRDVSRRPFSQSMLDDLLAATSILSVYEFLDHSGTEWSR
jgi:hypothetical protein